MKFVLSVLTPMAALALMASPASATIGVRVDFAFTTSELATEKGRADMLVRMKATASNACVGKRSAAYSSAEACREDLEQQFIAAIESQMLALDYQRPTTLIARAGG